MHEGIQGTSSRACSIRAKVVNLFEMKVKCKKEKYVLNHGYKIYTPHICHSLARSGSSEHHKFCECFDIVVADESITPRHLDPLNIFEPWKKVWAIDEDELVMLIISCSCMSLGTIRSFLFPLLCV